MIFLLVTFFFSLVSQANEAKFEYFENIFSVETAQLECQAVNSRLAQAQDVLDLIRDPEFSVLLNKGKRYHFWVADGGPLNPFGSFKRRGSKILISLNDEEYLENVYGAICIPQSAPTEPSEIDTVSIDSEDSLSDHIPQSTSEGELSYRCKWTGCKEAFTQESSFYLHVNSHALEARKGPFWCQWDNCHKSLSTKQNLQKHVMIHSGERPFKCPEANCLYSGRQSDLLKGHLQRRHPSTTQEEDPS